MLGTQCGGVHGSFSQVSKMKTLLCQFMQQHNKEKILIQGLNTEQWSTRQAIKVGQNVLLVLHCWQTTTSGNDATYNQILL